MNLEMASFAELWNSVATPFKAHLWIMAVGALLTGFTKFFSGGLVQGILSLFGNPALLWANWGDWTKRIFVFLFSAVGGVLTAMAGSMTWWQALLSVIPVAVEAHLMHSALVVAEQKKT